MLTTSPIMDLPDQSGTIVSIHELILYIIITQCPEFTSEFTLDAVHCMGLDNCVMTCIHHYGTI